MSATTTNAAGMVGGVSTKPLLRWDWLETCVRNHRGRRLIAEMDARTLADIGLDKALAEMEKPFWRA